MLQIATKIVWGDKGLKKLFQTWVRVGAFSASYTDPYCAPAVNISLGDLVCGFLDATASKKYDAANLAWRMPTSIPEWGARSPFTVIQHDEFDYRRTVVDRFPPLAGSVYHDFCPNNMFDTTTLKRTIAPNDVWQMRNHLVGTPFREGKF